MAKNELLDLILKDIKELEILVRGMQEMSEVPALVQNLAKTQTRNIYDGLSKINDAGLSVVKDQLARVEALAKDGSVAPSIAEEPVSVVTDTSVQNVQSVSYTEVDKTSEESAPLVDAPKISEPLVKETLSEEKNEEPKKTIIVSQPIEKEQEPKNFEPEIEKNVDEDKEIGTVIASKVLKETQEKLITNERFRTGVRSLNETIQVRKPEIRFVVSLKKAININDRFRYQKELFSNDSSLMNDAIEKLDAMNSLEVAKQYVSSFNWDESSDVVSDFMALLEARFSRAN